MEHSRWNQLYEPHPMQETEVKPDGLTNQHLNDCRRIERSWPTTSNGLQGEPNFFIYQAYVPGIGLLAQAQAIPEDSREAFYNYLSPSTSKEARTGHVDSNSAGVFGTLDFEINTDHEGECEHLKFLEDILSHGVDDIPYNFNYSYDNIRKGGLFVAKTYTAVPNSIKENLYFCKTCSEIFCKNCQRGVHVHHITEKLEVTIARSIESANIIHRGGLAIMKLIQRIINRRLSGIDVDKMDEWYDLLQNSTEQLSKYLNILHKSMIGVNQKDLITLKNQVLHYICGVETYLKFTLTTKMYRQEMLDCGVKNLTLGVGSSIPGLYQVKLRTMPLPMVLGDKSNPHYDLQRPWGVACDQFDHIFVADRSNHRIMVYTSSLKLMCKFGTFGKDPGQFHTPAGITVDKDQRVIVADKDNHRIQIFTIFGTFIQTFGKWGSDFGEFIYPWDVAVNSLSQIAVSDTRNNRVQLFSSNGIFLRSFGGLKQTEFFDIPRGICFTKLGNLLVCDFNNERIVEISSDFMMCSVFIERGDNISNVINRPQGIAIDDEDKIIIADSKNNRIQIRNREGRHIRNLDRAINLRVQMKRPCGVAITKSGCAVIVDYENNRVLIW